MNRIYWMKSQWSLANPLVRYQYERMNFYWSPYPLLILLIGIYLLSTAVRLFYWYHAHDFLTLLPEGFREAEAVLLNLDPLDDGWGYSAPRFERLMFAAQLITLFLCGLCSLLFSARIRRRIRIGKCRFSSLFAEDLRVLPLSSTQIYFASCRLKSAVFSLCFVLMALLLLLPSRNPEPWLHYRLESAFEFTHVRWQVQLMVGVLVLWMLLQSALRVIELSRILPSWQLARGFFKTWFYSVFALLLAIGFYGYYGRETGLDTPGAFLDTALADILSIFALGSLALFIQSLFVPRIIRRIYEDGDLAEAAVRRAVGA